jgi:DNA-binding MarR family transcriptional regulator
MSSVRNQQLLQLVRQLRALYRDLYSTRPINCDPPVLWGKSLTHSQSELLSIVAQHKTGITATDLAGILKISSGAITQLVDPLVTKELLTRREHPQDKRSVLIALKHPLSQPLPSFEEFYAAHISPMFEELTDKELHQLTSLIQKIKNIQ